MGMLKRFFAPLLFLTIFAFPSPVKAQDVETGYQNIMSQGLIFANICQSSTPNTCPCRDSGQCQLNDMIQIFVNISILILGVCGSIALLMFFYGGVRWVTSAGNPKHIETGKEIITRAVIGLAIIFGAYAFVNFLIFAISSKEPGQLPGATIEETIEQAT